MIICEEGLLCRPVCSLVSLPLCVDTTDKQLWCHFSYIISVIYCQICLRHTKRQITSQQGSSAPGRASCEQLNWLTWVLKGSRQHRPVPRGPSVSCVSPMRDSTYLRLGRAENSSLNFTWEAWLDMPSILKNAILLITSSTARILESCDGYFYLRFLYEVS